MLDKSYPHCKMPNMKEEVLAKLFLRQEQLIRENHRMRTQLKIPHILLEMGYLEPGSTPSWNDIDSALNTCRAKLGW